jgi:hypothetical protein
MKRISLSSLMLCVVAALVGCNPVSMAKHGFTELRGAHGQVYAVREAPAGFYQSLGGVTSGRVSNTIAPVCSPAMHRTIQGALQHQAREASAEMAGGGRACTVEVDITFNKEPGGVMALIGKGALLIGRVGVLDQKADKVADLIVVVVSEAVRSTPEEVAEEFASQLIGHIKRGGD